MNAKKTQPKQGKKLKFNQIIFSVNIFAVDIRQDLIAFVWRADVLKPLQLRFQGIYIYEV